MATANKVMLIGGLSRDPEIKTTQSGTQWARFSLAIEEVYPDARNEAVKKTSYPNCVAFGKQCERLAGCKKGDSVGVVGRLVTGSYLDKGGVKHYTTDVQCEKIVSFSLPHGAPAETSDPYGLDSFASAGMETPAGADVEIPF